MGSPLDSLGSFVGGVVHGAETAVGNVVHSVQTGLVSASDQAKADVLHAASQGTAALARVENGVVVGPLASLFGSDPTTFVNNACRSGLSHWIAIVNDCARRGGKTTYSVVDPKTGKPTNIPATISTKTPFNTIVLTAILAAESNPSLFIDAAGRESIGAGGTGKGIDDVYWWHGMHSPRAGSAHGFLEGIPLPTPTDLAAIAGVLAALATIFTVLAPIVKPILASAIGFVTSIIAPPAPKPDPNAGTIGGLPPVLILAVAAAGLALFFLWHKKGG